MNLSGITQYIKKAFCLKGLVLLCVIRTSFCVSVDKEPLKIAVLGFGSRANDVLLDCVKISDNIRVVAICDDYFNQSLDFFLNVLEAKKDPCITIYKKIFDGVHVYADNDNGLVELLKRHPDVDRIFITSPNFNHLRDLNAVVNHSACKKVYMEKPIFKSLDDLASFNMPDNDMQILIGLTLRYSSMAKIVAMNLQKFKKELGNLKKVKAHEAIRFNQGVGPFMMSWRRFISLSGGFLLEKCIHDLDLALFFIDAFGIDPCEIDITSHAEHKIFKQSNKQNIINEVERNIPLQNALATLSLWHFKPGIPLHRDEHNNIIWSYTIDAIFKNLPEDDNFDSSDIIPDYHVLNAVLKHKQGASIDFELKAECKEFALNTTRTQHFIFDHGFVTIDVMKSIMTIQLDTGKTYEFDLKTENSDHADGDKYIAKTILGMTDNENYIATIDDSIVRLASLMGLVSEYQVLHKQTNASRLVRHNNQWTIKKLINVSSI